MPSDAFSQKVVKGVSSSILKPAIGGAAAIVGAYYLTPAQFASWSDALKAGLLTAGAVGAGELAGSFIAPEVYHIENPALRKVTSMATTAVIAGAVNYFAYPQLTGGFLSPMQAAGLAVGADVVATYAYAPVAKLLKAR